MSEIKNPPISETMIERIKKIVEFHYGFTPKDEDIYRIDDILRSKYAVEHDQRIIRGLVNWEIGKDILKHRDRVGSLEFEKTWLEKTIFRYLTYATMCYRAGIPEGTISLCRTALEGGLRERLAEELAKKESVNASKLPEVTWETLENLKEKRFNGLIQNAIDEGIIGKQDFERVFQKLKFGGQNSRRILDKFIHGDIVWIVNFVKNREEDTRVVGAQDLIEEHRIISEMSTDKIAIEVLRATYKIAEILYFKNDKTAKPANP
ncbi:MAG TPA: hypothetical protein VMW67_04165 [Desulfobacteria bacterium]|nr:hypothetical protein [Desulfobacteria bacterium]